MKLWTLRPRDDLGDDDPWSLWYSRPPQIIVRARSETQARALACAHARREDKTSPLPAWDKDVLTPWLSKRLTICEELNHLGEAGVVLAELRQP